MQYVHWYAHAINLVMRDATESCRVANDFLGLLQRTATFISESHKRTQVRTKISKELASGQSLLHRLQKFCATGWWSKDRALESVFNDTAMPLEKRNKFTTLLICLHAISNTDDFTSEVALKDGSPLENWCKFHNIFMATILHDLFNSTTTTSNYVQASGLDYLTAANKIKTLQTQLLAKRNNFSTIHKSAVEFANYIQTYFAESEYPIDIKVELSEKRVSINKRQAGELTHDEARQVTSAIKSFEMNVFNVTHHLAAS